ncbi:DUF2946 domain-containing protein [Pseudomonas sp. NW5]|uniref:DUF2946 domain-containing protein n=1 Tax=Pseudomonas sp. NW5 TaxID=2934934 RepID=UPI00202134E2|nr:DUF2946 domain-containing protein [Pseudomonas sp. NW5]
MIRHARTHLAAWLGLFAVLMAFAGPLYSQLRALDGAALADVIDLQALHCSDEALSAESGPPEWVQCLAQCGYCTLLSASPALLPALQLWLPEPTANPHHYLPARQSLPQAPPAARRPRGPPTFHA